MDSVSVAGLSGEEILRRVKFYDELRADNERLRVALINMLDDGDKTDREQARAILDQGKD